MNLPSGFIPEIKRFKSPLPCARSFAGLSEVSSTKPRIGSVMPMSEKAALKKKRYAYLRAKFISGFIL